MEIVTVLGAHQNNNLILDTLESIFAHVSDKVLLVVDGASWSQFEHFDQPVSRLCGFTHGVARSPYRNVALGIKMAVEQWPTLDWLCYTEYDVLFASSKFRSSLELAQKNKVWMLGNDGHVDEIHIPLVESLIGEQFRRPYYLLGCCQFFHRDFLDRLIEIDFFDRFLHATSGFSEGYMPGYNGYDVSEHMYPSLCRQFGGNIGVFASYDELGRWHGAYRTFALRWKPELGPEDNFPEASVFHPLKDYDHPIRQYHREQRTK